ncbi:hypothetical protein FXV77_06770 [Sphingobacterium phlebotomi]|uniref:Uncharacterized protein n=1 Tax=Sphingobacterium phlebotomi TaxID=2605433 RepID=A0A5D4HBJ0_9SPHI|nr:hypothetical protein [Sphingobacterium phlebotomi]TYR36875.1 hypothetical protein FXV77_06770 [Sphingobacterium phlebotomi]
MDNLTYSVLAGLALLLIFLFVINEIRKYQRYKKMLDMVVEVQFHESEDAYDHMRRGTVMLHLYRSEEHIKAIVIKHLSFSDPAFHVPSLDKLYFKGKSGEQQLLSASFRIRRHTLRRLDGKKIHINLSGWISDSEGNAKPFKAHVPYTVGSFSNDTPSDNAPTAGMTALT